VPARTASGHGDRATGLALSILGVKREGVNYCGPWKPSEPDKRNLSFFAPCNLPKGIFISDAEDDDTEHAGVI
jgi:hypothetical protein